VRESETSRENFARPGQRRLNRTQIQTIRIVVIVLIIILFLLYRSRPPAKHVAQPAPSTQAE
jgi:hypothetical protein